MQQRIQDLFNDFDFIKHEGKPSPVLRGHLPDEILEEMRRFTGICREIKENNMGFLRNHVNGGTKGFGTDAGNSFQASLPANIVDCSYIFPFLNHLGEYFVHKTANVPLSELARMVQLRRHPGHFDAYDLWSNFAYKGDENPEHNHGGTISGVIYISDPEQTPTRFENGMSVLGAPGDIVMFPAGYKHSVARKTTNQERVTFAYNMDWKVTKPDS